MKQIILIAVIALCLFGCIGSQTTPTVTPSPTQTASMTLSPTPNATPTITVTPVQTASPTPQLASVQISGFAFNPATLTIDAGTTVTWTNRDSAPHQLVSDSGTVINSPTLIGGQPWSFTFTTPGTYAYHCSIHSSMKGTVIVR